jgi:hypothetical protein
MPHKAMTREEQIVYKQKQQLNGLAEGYFRVVDRLSD